MKPTTKPAVETLVSRAEEFVDDVFSGIKKGNWTYIFPAKGGLIKNIKFMVTRGIDKELLQDPDVKQIIKNVVDYAVKLLGQKIASYIEENFGLPKGSLAYRYNPYATVYSYGDIPETLDKFELALKLPKGTVVTEGFVMGDCMVDEVFASESVDMPDFELANHKKCLSISLANVDNFIMSCDIPFENAKEDDDLYLILQSTSILIEQIYFVKFFV